MAKIRIGMIGLDTSHCPTFTGLLNNAASEYHVPGGVVIGAYPGGSDLFSLSRNRVDTYTEQMQREFGIQIYGSIPALVEDVDAILLESVDGRQHLAQFQEAAAGKPVFIDKPLATSSEEAAAIVDLAQRTGTPIMSSSSLRYAAGVAGLAGEGAVHSCEAFGPAALLDDYPGLFWYGIHSAEMLFSFMGAGCVSVQCVRCPDTDVAIGAWDDGRTAVMRGTRFDKGAFGCIVHTDQGARCGLAETKPPYYYLLLQRVMAFFESGVSPIEIDETLNLVAFLEAAESSCQLEGAAVEIPAP